jgi:hypothetical protein
LQDIVGVHSQPWRGPEEVIIGTGDETRRGDDGDDEDDDEDDDKDDDKDSLWERPPASGRFPSVQT